MINLRNLTLRRGSSVLLNAVNWTIFHKQRIGIIGANGCGKTSLFSLLLGELQADAGDLDLPPQLKLSHVAQETAASDQSALDYVLAGDSELRHLQQALTHAEQQNDGQHIALLHARMGEIDAYTAPARAAQLLAGLSFSQEEQQQPVHTFSGGWRVRLNLARALMCRSDVLLLDEPTNHLDLDAVLWLENWLMHYPGTLLLISHDRDFLDHVVDHIVHIDQQQLTLYTGDYSTFEKQRAMNLMLQQAAYEKQQKHVAHLQSFINRFRAKASKARQAQSRMKALERMETVTAVHAKSPFQFHFKIPNKCPNPLISLQDADIAYDDHIVLRALNLNIAPEERIALIGPNGAGKTSLMKLLAGALAPSQGVRTTGAGLKIGYFAQHQIDYLNLNATPLEHLRELAPDTKEQLLRTFLGSFGFTENRTFETVNHFSGGEKSRLALALIIWQRPNLLLLDEPTNHLDMEMRHALCLALQEYEGAMIIVSHDRFLLRSTVDQLMLVADGELAPFPGDLQDYEKWLFNYRKQREKSLSSDTKGPTVSRKAQRQLDAQQREARRPLINAIKKLESQLEHLKEALQALEIQLANPALYEEHNKSELQHCLLQQADLKKQLLATEEAWLQASEQL